MKILLVSAKEESQWTSCRSIKQNLLHLYQSTQNVICLQLQIELSTQASDIKEQFYNVLSTEKINKIVFIDHRPNPAFILSSIKTLKKMLPPVIIHIYGDFTYFSENFLKLNNEFISHNIQFIAASTSQQKLINYFLKKPNCQKFPFLADTNFYKFDENKRNIFRKKFNLNNNQKAILYAGRISLQKNIDVIINEFNNYKADSQSDAQLFLAGPFDDFGARFMGARTLDGYYFQKINQLIAHSPYMSDIHLLGNLSTDQLAEAYCGADLYINYSLHHDEDFGIAPLEALLCDLPLLLTPWGGFKDFPAAFCSINLDSSGFNLSTGDLSKSINNPRVSYPHPKYDLTKIIFSEGNLFEGFNDNLKNYLHYFSTENNFLKRPNIQSTPSIDSTYYLIYSNYFDNSASIENSNHINWIFDHVENSKFESGFSHISNQIMDYEKVLPFSTSYYTPIAGDFFFQGSLGKIDQNEIIIRDGKKGMLNFFSKQQQDELKKTFYFNLNLCESIPANKNLGLVQIMTNESTNPINRLIISNLITEVSSNAALKKHIEFIIKLANDHSLNKIEILETENSIFYNSNKEIRNILLHNKFDIKPLTWKEFRSSTDLRKSYFYEINDFEIIAETFSQFFALSRGANCNLNLEIDEKQWLKTKEIKLSPYHQASFFHRKF